MRIAFLILLAGVLAAPCLAGTNVTVRVIEDNHGGTCWQVYSHGTNQVLKIATRANHTRITSSTGGYSITHTDADGDGRTESIMIQLNTGNILEVLTRSANGEFLPTPQADLDEMNNLAKQIEARNPKQ